MIFKSLLKNLGISILPFFLLHIGQAQSLLTQQLNFTVEQHNISETLLQLSQQSGVDIAFSPRFFKNQNININVKNQSLEAILNQILKNQSVGYKVIGQRIVLFIKKREIFTISGYLTDADSGERLIAATIFCPELQKGTTTNEYGFYSISLPKGIVNLQFSYLAYQPKNQTLLLHQNRHHNVALTTAITLQEVVVTPQQKDTVFIKKSHPHQALNLRLIQATPSLGGEEDILQIAQLQPGIQAAGDGLGSGIQVRGNSNGHNLMLLDGVPIYIPYHLLGLYSVYNSSTIASAQLLKGSFPARYGGRLSSVLDVRLREGNQKKWQAEVGANLTSFRALVEGPLVKGKGSILAASRWSPSAPLFHPLFREAYFQNQSRELYTEFRDINIKANYTFSKKDRLYLSFYQGRDEFYNISEQEIAGEEQILASEVLFDWDNTIAALRWNHLFSDKLFANTTITFSEYGNSHERLEEFFDKEEYFPEDPDFALIDLYYIENTSANQDWGAKCDFDYIPNPKLHFRFGTGFSSKTFIPDLAFFDFNDPALQDIDNISLDALDSLHEGKLYEALETYAYWENQIQFHPQWFLNLGARLSTFHRGQEDYIHLEPRFLLQYQFRPHIQFYLSGNKMVQYLHLVANSALQLPSDLWLPSGLNIAPQTAWQGEIGWQMNLKSKWRFSIEAYYKKMNHLYAFPDQFNFLDNLNEQPPENFLLEGNGRNYGLEMLVQFSDVRRGGILTYTLSEAKRRFAHLNKGLSFPYQYDQRHQVQLLLYQKLGKHFQVGLNGIFQSGHPRLLLSAVEPGKGFLQTDPNPLGSKNRLRTPPYHRLDLSCSYEYQAKKLHHRLKASLYNAYNQRNVYFYGLRENNNSEAIFGLSIIPSIAYFLKF